MPRRAILLCLAAVVACAERLPPAEVEWDHAATFTGLKTYAWYADPAWVMPKGNSIVDGAFIDRSVRAAVDEKLRKDGYILVSGGDASFYVAYQEGAAGGLSQGKWGAYSSQFNSYSPTEAQGVDPKPDPATISLFPPQDNYATTKYEKKETFLLAIRDSDRRIVWRAERTGWTGTNPDSLRKDIEHSVDVLLARFPPKS